MYYYLNKIIDDKATEQMTELKWMFLLEWNFMLLFEMIIFDIKNINAIYLHLLLF